MKIKHKLLEDYQLITNENKILSIKAGTIIENYTYDGIELDKSIIDSNSNYFEILNWKNELIIFMKKSKIPQPAILSKKLYPFMEEFIVSNQSKTENIQVNKIVEVEKIVEKIIKVTDGTIFDELIEREKKLILSEDDVNKRLKRVQEREDELKESIKQLDDREEDVLSKLKEITDKEVKLCKDLTDLDNLKSKLNTLKVDLDRRESLVDELEETIKEYGIKYSELEEINKQMMAQSEYASFARDRIRR